MPSLRTNFLRCSIQSLAYQYQIELKSKMMIQQYYLGEIQQLIYEKYPLSLYGTPFIYSVEEIIEKKHNVVLSNGTFVSLVFHKMENKCQGFNLIGIIAKKMLKMLQFMYCWQIDAAFNPFEEQKKPNQVVIPGLTINGSQIGDQNFGFYIVPFNLTYGYTCDFSGNGKIMINIDDGTFELFENIVKVDKVKNQIHFRNGIIHEKTSLREVTLKNISGFDTASKIQNYLQRVKTNSYHLLKSWQIKFDSKFSESPFSIIQPGNLTFRNNTQKSLSQLITPMSQHNYDYQYSNYFKNVQLDDLLQCQMELMISMDIIQEGNKIKKYFQMFRDQMGLRYQVRTRIFQGFGDQEKIKKMVSMHSTYNMACTNIYVFLVKPNMPRKEVDQLEGIVQHLIKTATHFHIFELTNVNYDLLVMKNLCKIYSKLKFNPWKIRNVPFGTQPLMIFTVNLSSTKTGLYSIAVVGTMNVYLTKFTANFKIVNWQKLAESIEECIKECLDKFKNAHSKYPNRAIIFRTGFGCEDCGEEYKKIKLGILTYSGSFVTYVGMVKEHPLRTYNQIDFNYISRDTVKKVQLLLYIQHKNDIYLQLQMEQSMHKIKIYEVQINDPHFVNKILELITKIVYGGVGNDYGKGLGLISYSSKLNQYKDYDLQNWKQLLSNGIMMFL